MAGLSDILSGLGRGAAAIGSFGVTELARKQQEERQMKQNADRQALANILSGQSIPAFARADGSMAMTPQEIEQTQLAQLAALGTPEALAVISKSSPLLRESPSPLSPLGKLQADIQAGMLPKNIGQAAIEKATAPAQPLVNINQNTESTRRKQRETRRGKFIDQAIEDADVASGIMGNLATIETNLDDIVARGGATGAASGAIQLINNLGAQAGLDINLGESANLTAIEGASNALAVPLTKQLGVNPTDKDFEIVKSTVARAGTSIPANYALVDVAKQAAKRKSVVADMAIRADDEGLDFKSLRSQVNAYKKNNPIIAPVPLPTNPNQLEVGRRYTTNKGVFIFDGKEMVRVR